MFRKTLTANDKYPVRDCENLPAPNQMQLSFNPKTFAHSLVPFLESTLNFKRFEKKDDRHSYFTSGIKTVKDLLRPLSEKHTFRAPFYSQHVKGSQFLVKSSWNHFMIFFS